MTLTTTTPSPEYADCHSSPHWMESIPVPADQRHYQIVDAWWRCVRCSTERYDQLDPVTLKVRGRKYRWPEGYRQGKDGPTRTQWKARHLQLVGVISEQQARRVRAEGQT